MGDAKKGGTYVSAAEARELAGRGPKGLPRGLERCGVCAEVRGRCLDPDNMFFKGDRDSDRGITKLVVPVHCLCDNVNRCARCRALLALRKLNGNYFKPEDGTIWHFPGFQAFRQACLREVAEVENLAG